MTEIEWLMSGDTGVSSETIMSVMTESTMGGYFGPDVPYDPGDFGRCYRLLKIFPEYRERLHEVVEKYPKWKPLVENWEKLTTLYEKEFKRSDKKAPELYKMMCKLLDR